MTGDGDDDDDSQSWMSHAFKNSALAADVLLSLRQPRILPVPWQCHLDRREAVPLSAAGASDPREDDERPSTSTSAAAAVPSPMSLRWGRRIRRSGLAREPRIRSAREAAAAAAVKSEKRRASPLSPLDGCSSGSTSWASGDGEEGTSSQAKAAKRLRSFGPAAVVVPSHHGGGSPMTHEAVLTIAAPGLANRAPTTKKYTTEGLRAVERSLLEEKAEMEKELEELRRAVEKLRASNREMQMSLEKTKPPVTDAKANDTTQLSDSSFPNAHQPKRREFLLPDLNELPCSD